jgi:CheY-like chemotaxis protein
MAIEGISHSDSDLPQPNYSSTGGSASVGQDVILFIDDDAEVLNSVRRLLIREGWVVLTASSPLEGPELCEALWREIQLVLLDYFMPNLRGDEVFERLQRINPRVRVLLTTSCDDYVSQKMIQGGLCGFIQKPISRRDLTRKIHHAMNHHDPPTLLAETAQINQDSICKIGFLP